MIADFEDILLPARLVAGSAVEPHYRTEIVETGSGFEYRNAGWNAPRRRYLFGGGAQDMTTCRSLADFFHARRGRLVGFLWHDWLDDSTAIPGAPVQASDTVLRALDSTLKNFVLEKVYGKEGATMKRRLVKPRAATLKLARNGTALQSSDYRLDTRTGIVTLASALSPGDVLTGGCRFDVPVRFDTDMLRLEKISDAAARISPLSLIELQLPLNLS
jgi:uncharacterized protein (TIGR02217 family)